MSPPDNLIAHFQGTVIVQDATTIRDMAVILQKATREFARGGFVLSVKIANKPGCEFISEDGT